MLHVFDITFLPWIDANGLLDVTAIVMNHPPRNFFVERLSMKYGCLLRPFFVVDVWCSFGQS